MGYLVATKTGGVSGWFSEKWKNTKERFSNLKEGRFPGTNADLDAWGQGLIEAKKTGDEAEYLRHHSVPGMGVITTVATMGAGALPKVAQAETISLFRAVGIRELESISVNKAFLPGANSLEGRQFAKTFEEAMAYARTDLSKVAIVEVQLQKYTLPAFDFSKRIDPHIFTNGVYTVQPGVQSQIFNNAIKSIKQVE